MREAYIGEKGQYRRTEAPRAPEGRLALPVLATSFNGLGPRLSPGVESHLEVAGVARSRSCRPLPAACHRTCGLGQPHAGHSSTVMPTKARTPSIGIWAGALPHLAGG